MQCKGGWLEASHLLLPQFLANWVSLRTYALLQLRVLRRAAPARARG